MLSHSVRWRLADAEDRAQRVPPSFSHRSTMRVVGDGVGT
jgi:hypothetical protein